MKLYRNGKLVTDFTKKEWWAVKPVDKVWIDELN